MESKKVVIYVDGSKTKDKKARWAYFAIDNSKVVGFGSGKIDDLAAHNVTAELTAVMKAIEYAKNNGYDEIELRYDYEGIEKFVTGEWIAKDPFTKKYTDYVKNSGVKIKFVKTNKRKDALNLAVDALAKGDVSAFQFYATMCKVAVC